MKTVEKIVAATVCLHNFLRIFEKEVSAHKRIYCPPSFIDSIHSDGSITSGLFRDGHTNNLERIGRLGSNNASRSMIELRDNMVNYIFVQ